ncbi:response regulator [Myxococcota bacterium]|nr:response regulator [Myxococcota bacterium]
MQQLLREYLTPTRAEILQAYDGHAGVTQVLAAAAAGQPIALVLMDQQMPGLDGYTATRQLRRLGHTMPIVAITAAGVESNRLLAERSGCSAWLPKPLLPEDLYRVISDLLFEDRSGAHPVVDPLRPVESAPLSDLGDDPARDELLQSYLRRLGERRGLIQQAHARGASADLRRLAHQIRGSASSYGFPALGQAAARLEEALDAGQAPAAVDARVEELLAVVDRALAAT